MKPSALLVAAMAAVVASAAAAAPPPTPVTPELVAAAQKEGKVVFYTAMDIQVGEGLAQAFEVKYPGVAVDVERSGAERIFQRVGQEYASGIHAVDAVDSSDTAHFRYWKEQGWLAAFVPEDVARWPEQQRDGDGFYATSRATLSVIGYNTRLVKPEDAPKSYADMLDPKWSGKIVRRIPAIAVTS